jgi:predicted Zn-dependent peptidase
MKIKIVLNLLIICFLMTTAVQASEETAGTLNDRVQEKILDNGLRVVVVERHSAPVFFTLVSFRVGAAHESPNHSGLSHFLEHMLFKGTKTIGTKDIKKELPIMGELEQVAINIKEIQIALKSWRYEMFDEYATKIKAELPQELREEIGADEAAGWRAVLKQLPENTVGLPEEWTNKTWLLEDREHQYWTMYRELLENRAQMAELIVKQREYINQAALEKIYDTHGSQSYNAFTSYDQTTYMVGLPSNCLELWMYIESDRFQNPIFREFYSEKEVVTEEKEMYANQPGSIIYNTFMKTAFDAHPYGRPILGWKSDIELTLRTDMEEHFKRFYAPNNCQLTIVGDVDAKQVFKLAEQYFKSWKPSEVADEVTVDEPEQNGERRVTIEYDAEPRIMLGYHVPVEPHPDAYILSMISYILSSGRTSRFHKSIFVEQGLTASAPGSWRGPDDRYPNLFTISATPKSPHTNEEVEAAILMEIEKLKVDGVTPRELERARNNFNMSEISRLGSNQWLAFALNNAYVNRGDWHTITEDLDRLMQVTQEDIQRVTNKYFTKKNKTVAVMIKPTEVANTVEVEEGVSQ